MTTTRRDFFKGAAAMAALGFAAKASLPPDNSLEIDFHVSEQSHTGDSPQLVYVNAHASWDPGPSRREWSGEMTVRDTPEAIEWAKDRLKVMLLQAYHA